MNDDIKLVHNSEYRQWMKTPKLEYKQTDMAWQVKITAGTKET